MKNDVEKQRKSGLLYSVVTVCVLSVIIMCVTVFTPKKETGEFVPPPFDLSAEQGSPIVPNDIYWQEFDAKAFKVGICGKINMIGSNADIWLYNSAENDVWLKVRILKTDGTVLGETGVIRPDEYVKSVELNTEVESDSPLLLKVMAYQPNTYFSEGSVNIEAFAYNK
ncbi:MAG: hypothetical protein E7477_08540 [Ruminococcaceae bacterium]|nr:hypothetical protein [Oscillospiraceae bacterium]